MTGRLSRGCSPPSRAARGLGCPAPARRRGLEGLLRLGTV